MADSDPSKVDFTKDEEYRLYPGNPTSSENVREFAYKEHSKFYDPCAEAAKMSMSCLERNNYDRKPCKQYFEVYRDCMAAFRKTR